MQEIANNICEFIQVEIDYPSSHENGMMPLLDLEVMIKNNKIVYQYYRKSMANFLVLMAKSAMPLKMRRISLIQETIRIQRNISKKFEEKIPFFLSEFMVRMMLSGYSERMRHEVVQSGVKAFEKQKERDERGICPLYRPKGYKESERKLQKEVKKTSWYKPNDAVMFCPPTPRGILAKNLRKVTEEMSEQHNIKVKVIERAGVRVKTSLPGLKVEKNCKRTDCMVHQNGGKGDCNKEGVIYKGQCLICDKEGKNSTYIGESSRSGYFRGRQHLKAIGDPKKHPNNAFAKHLVEYHQRSRITRKFKMNIIDSYKRPLQRQLREGIEIYKNDADIKMNSKLDHHQPAINRVVFTQELET